MGFGFYEPVGRWRPPFYTEACVLQSSRFARLRELVRANNRLDLFSLITSGVGTNELDGHVSVVEQWQDDETHNPDVPTVSHRRGLAVAPFVLVPFEEVETSVLNLSVDKMDYFVPG